MPGVGVTLTPTDIINKFNTLVRAGLPALASANYYRLPSITVPGSGYMMSMYQTDPRFGNRAEPPKTVADFNSAINGGTAGAYTGTSVYNIMHAWAMELTRVRRVTYVFGNGHTPGVNSSTPANVIVHTTGYTALNDNFRRYFPIPLPNSSPGGVQPTVGAVMTETEFDAFLGRLRVIVMNIRNSINTAETVHLYSCHSNCHSSCHSSRNRR